jgi:hypothetical protein
MSSELQVFYTRIPTRQYNPNLTGSFIKGVRYSIGAVSGSSQNIYTLTFTASLTKVGVHMSVYTDLDYWNLSGSDWQLFDTVYTKTIPESFVLDIGKDLVSGSQIIFDFYNSSATSKVVWIDFYFIR